jgi:pSer/pThr/pTyr-binding forkhead associated (FHA) protein
MKRYVLRAENGLQMGHVYLVQGPRLVLGRSLESHIQLDDPRVSRQHAAIDAVQGMVHIVDLESSNGTYLNGVRIERPSTLKLGDEIRVGSTVLRFAEGNKEASATGIIAQPKSLGEQPNSAQPTKTIFDDFVQRLHWLSQASKTLMRLHGRWIVFGVSLTVLYAAIQLRLV